MKEKIRNIISILLVLLPILVIHVGYSVVSGIRSGWKLSEQEKYARQKLDDIAANTDFSALLSSYGAKFRLALQTLPINNTNILRTAETKAFKKPFPTHETFVFSLSKGNQAKVILAPDNYSDSKRALSLSFSHLVTLNRGTEQKEYISRRNKKLLKKIFSSLFLVDLFGAKQKGIATPVVYKNVPSWLLWDYTKHENGNTVGFFVIVSRIDNDIHKSLYEMSAALSNLGKGNPGGFIRIFQQGANDQYYPASIASNKEFMSWRAQLGICANNSKKWEIEGFPWKQKVDHNNLYTRILPGKKHIAFLLLPQIIRGDIHPGIFAINLLLISFFIGLLIRGLLLDRWPLNSLTQKFLFVYVISITLPAGLYVSSVYAYMYETEQSGLKQIEETLIKELLFFESGRNTMIKEYESSFRKILSDKVLLSELKQNNLNNKKVVFDRMASFFKKDNKMLPLDYLALHSIDGKKIFNVFSKSKSKELDKIIGFYSVPLITALRELLKQETPGIELPPYKPNNDDSLAANAYQHKDKSIETEFDRFRGQIYGMNSGENKNMYFHDFVPIDGAYRYVLQGSWSETDLSAMIIKKSAAELGIKNTNVKFMAFGKKNKQMEAILPPDKSIDNDLYKFLENEGRSSFGKNLGISRFNFKNYSVVTLTSKEFHDVVLVAALSHDRIDHNYYFRFALFLILGILSFIFMLISAYITYLRSVFPIRQLKTSLKKINAGNLSFDLVNKRSDEIGILTEEFSSMVSGLRERERLASILSDQAMSVISSNQSIEHVESSANSFKGVVLITDIRDFTTLCECNDTPIITQMLNDHFAEMVLAITNHGGRVYKFIGDAVEAVFLDDEDGWDTSAEERAVSASEEMLARLKLLNTKRDTEDQFTYKIGIGLAHGEIIGGAIGSSESRLDYALLSDAFNKAEHNETTTKQMPSSPLMFDEKIKNIISKNDVYAISSIEVEHEKYFYIENINERIELLVNKIGLNVELADRANTVTEISNVEHSKSGISIGRLFTFIFGVLCTIIPIIFWFQFQYSSIKQQRQNSKSTAIAQSNYMGHKLLSNNSPRSFFDEFINSQIDNTVDNLPDKIDSNEILKKEFDHLYNSLSALNITPSLFFIEASPSPEISQYICNAVEKICLKTSDSEKRKEKYAELLEELILQKKCPQVLADKNFDLKDMSIHSKYKPVCMYVHGKKKEIIVAYHQLFSVINWRIACIPFGEYLFEKFQHRLAVTIGRDISRVKIEGNLFSRLVSTIILGEKASIFWKYLIKWDKKSDEIRTSIEEPALLRKIDSFPSRTNLGSIMCVFPEGAEYDVFTKILPKIMTTEEFECLIVSEQGNELAKTKDFPYTIAELDNSKFVEDNKDWILRNHLVKLEKKLNVRVYFAKRINAPKFSSLYFPVILAICILLITMLIWYLTVYSERVFSKKFSWQLWLGLLVATSLPLSSVFVINEFFAQEQKTLRPKEERIRLLNYCDGLERRAYLVEALDENRMHDISFNKEFHKLLKNQKEPPKKQIIVKLTDLLLLFKKNYQNLSFNELLISSKYGWSVPIYSHRESDKTGQFLQFIKAVSNRMFDALKSKVSKTDVDKNMALKDELTIESAFELFNSIFGTTNALILTGGVGMSVEVKAENGLAYLKFLPYPSLAKPDFLFYWQKFDALAGNLRRIAKHHNGKYGIFTFYSERYGSLFAPKSTGWFREAINIGRWMNATRIPMSSNKTIAGNEYLIEAREGNLTTAMTIIALAGKNKILSEIENKKNDLLWLLLASILAIIFLAVVVSSDITSPIVELTKAVGKVKQREFTFRLSSERRDEFGELFSEFNLMVRGLEEKEMMGKMVSRTARLATSDENSHIRAEEGMELDVVIMFIVVPSFDMYLSMTKPRDLFDDLQQHVDKLCHIVIDNGGDIDKLIGEKVLAVFYDPRGVEFSAKAALKTTNDMMKAEKNGDLKFPVALGLHNGPVIAGLLGVGKYRDFTVIGDTVNTASRIAGKASLMPMERVLVSKNFKSLVAAEAVFRQHGEVELKGKAEAMSLYQTVFR